MNDAALHVGPSDEPPAGRVYRLPEALRVDVAVNVRDLALFLERLDRIGKRHPDPETIADLEEIVHLVDLGLDEEG